MHIAMRSDLLLGREALPQQLHSITNELTPHVSDPLLKPVARTHLSLLGALHLQNIQTFLLPPLQDIQGMLRGSLQNIPEQTLWPA